VPDCTLRAAARSVTKALRVCRLGSVYGWFHWACTCCCGGPGACSHRHVHPCGAVQRLDAGGGVLKALQAVAAAEEACARELPGSQVPSWGVQAQLRRLLDAYVAQQLNALKEWLLRLLASENWQPISAGSPSCARHACAPRMPEARAGSHVDTLSMAVVPSGSEMACCFCLPPVPMLHGDHQERSCAGQRRRSSRLARRPWQAWCWVARCPRRPLAQRLTA